MFMVQDVRVQALGRDGQRVGMMVCKVRAVGWTFTKPPWYLLYRALGALVPYIVGTWGVRVHL